MKYIQIKIVGRKIPIELTKQIIDAIYEIDKDATILFTGAGQKILQTIINVYTSYNPIEHFYNELIKRLPFSKRILSVKIKEKSEGQSQGE